MGTRDEDYGLTGNRYVKIYHPEPRSSLQRIGKEEWLGPASIVVVEANHDSLEEF